jgi:hypothetical protein
LALGLVAPSRVLATCGDYVTMARHQVGSVPQPAVFEPETPKPTVAVDRELPQMTGGKAVRLETSRPLPCRQCPATPGQAPCQGPWCSGSHRPLTVPTTTTPSPREDSAVCASMPRFGTSEPIAHAFLDDQAARIHHVLPIYHPPRSA